MIPLDPAATNIAANVNFIVRMSEATYGLSVLPDAYLYELTILLIFYLIELLEETICGKGSFYSVTGPASRKSSLLHCIYCDYLRTRPFTTTGANRSRLALLVYRNQHLKNQIEELASNI